MTAVPATAGVRAARVRPGWLLGASVALAAVAVAGLGHGAVSIPPDRIVLELLDRLPGIALESDLTRTQANIIWEIRLPRVVLGMLVGAMLAVAGASYQGVFRNPLADPFLLGAAAGAGLGATLAITGGFDGSFGMLDPAPLAAFVGAIAAVALSYAIATVGGGGDRSPAVLLLAGVAVAAFMTACQTFLLQRNADSLREVYSWLLGRLGTSGWSDVAAVTPYFVATTVLLLAHRRILDVLAVGDDEASSLGIRTTQTRVVIIVGASLATAAAVSVSGLIGFVGIIVPHTVRLLVGGSYRVILPLSVLLGGVFLGGADLLARTAQAPAEIPIGVLTAFLGAPFFALVLRRRRSLVA